jgi:hypothetical protein
VIAVIANADEATAGRRYGIALAPHREDEQVRLGECGYLVGEVRKTINYGVEIEIAKALRDHHSDSPQTCFARDGSLVYEISEESRFAGV